MFDFGLSGDEALMAKLDKLRGGFIGAMEGAVASGALLVVNSAKEKVPYLTGTLRRSLHIGGFTSLTPDYEPGNTTNAKSFGDIGKGPKSDDHVELLVGTNLDYAKAVEGGSSKQAPSGYLRPALDEQKDAAIKETAAAFRAILEKLT